MKNEIEQLAWMSPATKQEALRKLAAHPQQDRLSGSRGAITAQTHDRSATITLAMLHRSIDFLRAAATLRKIGKPVDLHGVGYDTRPRSTHTSTPQMNDINFPCGRAATTAL